MANQGTIKLGPWGGIGGSDWSYNPRSGSTLKEIVINHGRFIDSITFKSIDPVTGQITFLEKFGGDGGKTDHILFDLPGEYLTMINGTINDWSGHTVIESISFHTNRTKYGPYGKTSGSGFEIPMEGGEIVGFHGRAGDKVDAIGVYAKPSAT